MDSFKIQNTCINQHIGGLVKRWMHRHVTACMYALLIDLMDQSQEYQITGVTTWSVQAKEKADGSQGEGVAKGQSDDIQAAWRMRAGSALDDLRLEKQEPYDSLNIQVS